MESHSNFKRVAQVLTSAIVVSNHYVLESQYVLETPCKDFDDFKVLPKIVNFENRTYTCTGWNSDNGVAYYKTGLPMAYAVA